MQLYAALFEISKLLLAEDEAKTAEVLLDRVVRLTEAARGFIVVREGESYEERFQVRFDHSQRTRDERQFSRSLVRRAIETREAVFSLNLQADPRFASLESVRCLRPCSVLVAPLQHEGEVYGVVYLDKPADQQPFSDDARRFLDELAQVAGLFVRRAVEREELRRRNASLERELLVRYDFRGIVTRDAAMLSLLELVGQVADSSATVLVRGETGTGKELIARALHVNSPRRAKPLATLNCAALPGTLLEDELFGHVKGAFTGAQADRAGRIASAAGGTLFLDEVGEMPLELQAKLLRFLDQGELQRVGSDRVEKIDARVVAATHRDPARLVEQGRFRQDLYYRLRVVELRIPPLRERRGDLPLLLGHFLERYWRRPREAPRFTPRAERALLAYDYPGNVRELANVVERACLLAKGPELDLDLLPPELGCIGTEEGPAAAPLRSTDLKAARDRATSEVEREFLTALMTRCEGNVSRAAQESGMRRSHLQKLLAKHWRDRPRPWPQPDRTRGTN